MAIIMEGVSKGGSRQRKSLTKFIQTLKVIANKRPTSRSPSPHEASSIDKRTKSIYELQGPGVPDCNVSECCVINGSNVTDHLMKKRSTVMSGDCGFDNIDHLLSLNFIFTETLAQSVLPKGSTGVLRGEINRTLHEGLRYYGHLRDSGCLTFTGRVSKVVRKRDDGNLGPSYARCY